MAHDRRPKGPRGGRFTERHAPETDIVLEEEIARTIQDAVGEVGELRQPPPPKTEEAKEIRLDTTLTEIRQSLDLAAQFVAEGRARMQSSIERRMAVERLSENLGEQAKRLPTRYRQEHDGVDWKGLIGLRDRLSHGYGLEIDEDILWRALAVDLPALRRELDISGPPSPSATG